MGREADRAERAGRKCACGTRLSIWNTSPRCAVCERMYVQTMTGNRPPVMPYEFWASSRFRHAFETRDMGKILRLYRTSQEHRGRFGPDGITQELLAAWLGLSQAQVSSIECGKKHADSISKMIEWAETLSIPNELLWFDLPSVSRFPGANLTGEDAEEDVDPSNTEQPTAAELLASEIKRFRMAAKLTQRELAQRSGYTREYISMAERRDRNIPSYEVVRALDTTLNADGYLLELRTRAKAEQAALRNRLQGSPDEQNFPRHQHQSENQIRRSGERDLIPRLRHECQKQTTLDENVEATTAPEGSTEVNRLEFIAGLLATVTFPRAVLEGAKALDPGDVSRFRRSLNQLYSFDDQQGASRELYSLTVRSLRQVTRTMESASYSTETGLELRSIVGEMAEHAGWLAFDSGRHGEARYWWLEALHMARLNGTPGVETVVLASMSLQAGQMGRAREATELAQAAQRAAKNRQTPRLMSLLHAREALGHALQGDKTSVRRAFQLASKNASDCQHDDDPLWLDFWGSADLSCHEVSAAHYLDDLSMAENAARRALAEADPLVYPRNHALYSIGLARTLSAQKKFDEAVPLIMDAINLTTELLSERVQNSAIKLVQDLKVHTTIPIVRELIDWVSSNDSLTGQKLDLP